MERKTEFTERKLFNNFCWKLVFRYEKNIKVVYERLMFDSYWMKSTWGQGWEDSGMLNYLGT